MKYKRPVGPVEAVLSITAIGAENALPSAFLMAVLGWTNERRFRALVERERRRGALILSCKRGLFLPSPGEKGRQELRRYVRTGEARIKGQAVALRPARKVLNTLEGQLALEEEGRGET